MTKLVKRSVSRVTYRLPKRRKSSSARAIRENRKITWDEQKLLPERFREDIDVWPVSAILAERPAYEGRKEYLLQWEPHPVTGEVFEPTWESENNVGDGLIETWESEKYARGLSRKQNSYSGGVERLGTLGRAVNGVDTRTSVVSRRRARRLSSESTTDYHTEEPYTASRLRRTNAISDSEEEDTSPLAIANSPQFEISETQQPIELKEISVDLPPPPSDQTNYETLRSSQIDAITQGSSLHSSRISPVLDKRQAPTVNSQLSNRFPEDSSAVFAAHSSLIEALHHQPASNSVLTSPTPEHTSQSPFRLSRKATRNIVDSSSSSELSFGIPQSLPAPIRHLSRLEEPVILPSSHQRGGNTESPSLTPLPTGRQNSTLTPNSLTSPPELASIPYTQQHSLNSSPWIFETQVPSSHKLPGYSELVNGIRKLSQTASRQFPNTTQALHHKVKLTNSNEMATPPARQSPRLQQAATLANGLFPMSVPPENGRTVPSSQLAKEMQVSIDGQERLDVPLSKIDSLSKSEIHDNIISKDFAVANGESYEPRSPIERNNNDVVHRRISSPKDNPFDGSSSSLPIHQSIENDAPSLEDASSQDSQASSSQQSLLDNERIIPRVDGMIMPSLPIVGLSEFVIGLPAEGKVQSTYMDIIKVKKRSILKFVNRKDSGGSANNSTAKMQERNEMVELISRLHDTTTHLDLGLPGFSTQYSIESEQHAAYANYAGSKFAFLGHLVDVLRRVDCPLMIMVRSGPIQDLLEDYLRMKHITVRRHDRLQGASPPDPRKIVPGFQIDLASTTSFDKIQLRQRPSLIIAFDSSFDSQDPRVKRIRSYDGMSSELVPVVHLLVLNSSEHVDRCLPKSMPSPIRLKLLVRATYQARVNLGGDATYIEDPSDTPQNRQMDMADFQRAMRKSVDRKLVIIASIVARAAISQDFRANWTLVPVPELQLEELDELPPKPSQVTTTAGTPREISTRSRSPISRGVTPSGRKRFLEPETNFDVFPKRQRLTPVPDSIRINDSSRDLLIVPEDPQVKIKALQAELAAEKQARQKVEEALKEAEVRVEVWQQSHATLQRRYEKRMTKTHELAKINKKQLTIQENARAKQEKIIAENTALKTQVTQLKLELSSARNELKSAGGDTAILEQAREETRTLAARNTQLEKTIENIRKDFEFTRTQYQTASNKAAEFANQVNDLETQVGDLGKQASDEKRRLKELNYQESIKKHTSKVAEMELSMRSRDILLKKLEEENRILKKNRGVQTRGSSVQPGSPGGRSRQASPAYLAVPSGSRTSVLRHER